MVRAQVLICGGTGCTSSGSVKLIPEFEAQIAKNGLEEEIKIVKTGCSVFANSVRWLLCIPTALSTAE